jgi:hypothetical protein
LLGRREQRAERGFVEDRVRIAVEVADRQRRFGIESRRRSTIRLARRVECEASRVRSN